VRKPAFPTLLPVTGRRRPDICWQAVGKPEFLALLGDKNNTGSRSIQSKRNANQSLSTSYLRSWYALRCEPSMQRLVIKAHREMTSCQSTGCGPSLWASPSAPKLAPAIAANNQVF